MPPNQEKNRYVTGKICTMENDDSEDTKPIIPPKPPNIDKSRPQLLITDVEFTTAETIVVESDTQLNQPSLQPPQVLGGEEISPSPSNLTKPEDDNILPIVDAANSSDIASQSQNQSEQSKKCVLFDTVTVYFFTRSQGFSSIPSQGGSTLGMKRRHFFSRRLSVDMFEEVRRKSRRAILLKIRLEKDRLRRECEQLHCNSISSSTSSTSNTTTSDSDDSSSSDLSDISDSELGSDSYIFVQPFSAKLRRSLLRASGVCRIDPKEKKECKSIRDSREKSGCKCENECIPGECECSLLGVNCHVDRISFPCSCISSGCQNPQGRTEFDMKQVRGHLIDTLIKNGVDLPSTIEQRLES